MTTAADPKTSGRFERGRVKVSFSSRQQPPSYELASDHRAVEDVRRQPAAAQRRQR